MFHTPAHPDCEAIHNLSLEFMDPLGAERAMKKSLQSKLKYQEKIIMRDQFICLKNVGTNEVRCFAIKVCNKIKFNKEETMKRIIKFLMNIKIADVTEDLEKEKTNVQNDKNKLENIVRPNTFAGRAYREYVKTSLEKNWKLCKENSGRRINHLKHKFTNKISPREQKRPPEKHCGVRLRDDNLEEIEEVSKVNVHSDVDLSEKERKAVEVLPKDTFYNNIYINEAEQQTEITFAKMRWNEKKRKDDEHEEDNRVFDVNTNTIDLSNKKATDMRSNQRVKLVDPDKDDEKEIKRDHIKLKVIETYKEYRNEHFNEKGEIRNLMSEYMREGMNDVKEKTKAKKIKVVQTDKTNKISVMHPKTYVASMIEHHRDDEE